jgi:hypothetical protein
MARKNRHNKKSPSATQKLKYIKKRRVYHQPYQPQHPMSLCDEDAAIDLCFLLFCVLTLHLGPSLWNFMTRTILNDPMPIVVDAYEFLKTIIDLRRTNASLFTTNSPTDMINLETAQKGRLAVVHGYFDEDSRNWSVYLLSWVAVLKMIDAHTAAASVQAIHDELISGNKKPLDVVIFSFTRPDFMKRGVSLQKETELSRAQYIKAIRIQMALYRSVEKILGQLYATKIISEPEKRERTPRWMFRIYYLICWRFGCRSRSKTRIRQQMSKYSKQLKTEET